MGKPSDSTNDKTSARQGGDQLVPVERQQNLLDLSTHNLSEEEARAIRSKALDAKLDIDKKRAEADDRYAHSSRDMVNTVGLVGKLEQTSSSDFEVNSHFDTASGHTSVRVKKTSNQAIVVIAIVVAVVILIVMLQG